MICLVMIVKCSRHYVSWRLASGHLVTERGLVTFFRHLKLNRHLISLLRFMLPPRLFILNLQIKTYWFELNFYSISTASEFLRGNWIRIRLLLSTWSFITTEFVSSISILEEFHVGNRVWIEWWRIFSNGFKFINCWK